MVPGGQGVFPSLTVRENLQLAGWLHRKDKDHTPRGDRAGARDLPDPARAARRAGGNLSGGQQQMLTLGMAFIEQPRLLMIDELSLGLAPSVVGQLLEIVRELKAAGTTIILVEQSVNVALTVAETAYFMEKGEIRFHGPTAELLERPDVLRSVFLEGAGTHDDARSPASRPCPPIPARPVDATATANAARDLRLEVRDLTKRFGGITALDQVSFAVARGRDRRVPRPERRGQDHAVRRDLRVHAAGHRARSCSATRRATSTTSSRSPPQTRAKLGLGRSFQDGRLFPALTVTETIAVALECSVDVRDPLAAALHLPAVVDSEAKVEDRVEELIELMGLGAFRDKFVHELSTGSRRIVDLACILAHQPTVLLLDEPSSGIAQREAEALGPLLLRIRDSLGASILVIEHDLPLLTSVADRHDRDGARRGDRGGRSERRRPRPAGRGVVPGNRRSRHLPLRRARRRAAPDRGKH